MRICQGNEAKYRFAGLKRRAGGGKTWKKGKNENKKVWLPRIVGRELAEEESLEKFVIGRKTPFVGTMNQGGAEGEERR